MSSSISSSEAAVREQARAKAGARGALRFLAAFALSGTLALGGIWLFTARYQDGFLDPEYGMWTAKEELAASCDLGSTLVLGDSRAVAGFIPAELGRATNLALGGASPIEMYYMAQRVLKCPQVPKRVILSFSVPQFIKADYYWPRAALFAFLNDDELEQVRRASRRLGDTSLYSTPNFADLDARMTDWLYAHHFPSYAMASVINGHLFGRLAENRRLHAETFESRGQHPYKQNGSVDVPAEEADIPAFKPSPLITLYLRKLVDAFTSRGAQVFFVAAPLNRPTVLNMNPSLFPDMTRYLERLQSRNPDFHVLLPTLIEYPDAYFSDSTHLNETGARHFSAQIKEELDRLDKQG